MIILNQTPTHFRPLFVALVLVSLLGALDQTIVASSLATVAGELGGVEHMAWAIVSYTLAGTIAIPIYGQLGDLRGRRGLFLSALVLFLVGSVLCGFAQDMAQLTLARVVQGFGGAGVGLLSQTIVADVTAPRDRAKYQGMLGSVFGIAVLAGPLAGGLLTDTVGWRWIFWINVPLGLLALALALRTVPHSSGIAGRFDVPGAALLAIGSTGLVLLATWGGTVYPWTSPLILAIVAVTLVATAAFFIVELRAAHPLVPLHIFSNRTVVLGTILSAVVGVGLFSAVSYIPGYVQMIYNTTATVAGSLPIAMVVGMMITSNAVGFLVSRTGRYRGLPIVGTAASAVGLFWLAALGPDDPLWLRAALTALIGLGTGAFMQVVVAVVQNAASESIVGAVTSTVNLVRQVGSTVATAVVGGAFAGRLVAGLPSSVDAATLTPAVLAGQSAALQHRVAEAYVTAMSPVFVGLGVVYVVGFAAALLLPQLELSDRLPVEASGAALPQS